MNRQRRITIDAKIGYFSAKGFERIDEIADWALVHARDAGQTIFAASERQRCR